MDDPDYLFYISYLFYLRLSKETEDDFDIDMNVGLLRSKLEYTT